MSAPISVCILACDEELELERCIRAVQWADEVVVVVDEKSRDGSEAVARRLASRVERRPYSGDIDQKRYCTSLAKHDWVLIVDPDEVVSDRLATSIRRVLVEQAAMGQGGGGDSVVAYQLNRLTYHLGRWIRHGDYFPDWKLRLFRKSHVHWTGRDPHGRVEVEGPEERIEGDLLHYSYRDLADQVARIQLFSDQAAHALVRDGVRFRIRDLILRPPARFLRGYILRGGFRDGIPGFIIAAASSFYVLLKYAKQWEKQAELPPRSPDDQGLPG
ncbi:MAG: glycosyltransferase family 2 protein [Myxococcales bacterium]|nr:glycosyltransferase family 2 protein [Myxococcales bacterium]HIK84999.1 glycosyltransferase family 2 protein [Myxococcales bacterium]